MGILVLSDGSSVDTAGFVTLNGVETLTNKTLTSPTINGGTHAAITSLGIRSTGTGAFDLTIDNTENLTAGRTLTVTLNDVARTLNMGGNITTANSLITSGNFALTLTATATTNSTFPAGTDTLAGLGTAQTFTAKQTFTASTTEITALSLLDTTYKPALDVTSTDVVRIGGPASGGFSTLLFGGGTNNLTVVLDGSTSAFSSSGPVTWTITATNSTAFAINRGTSTSNTVNFIAFNPFGTYAPTTSGAGTYKGINLSDFTINQTGTSNQVVTLISIAPTTTSVLGTVYGVRSQLPVTASAGAGLLWNIYADGTAPNLFSGGMHFTQTTKAQLTGNQNDYAIGAGRSFRMSSDASRNVTGIAGGTDGRVLLIYNIGAQNIVFTNEDAASTAANRILTSTGGNITVAGNGCIGLEYDDTTDRWRDFLAR